MGIIEGNPHCFYGKSADLLVNYWAMEKNDRPLIGCNLYGKNMNQNCPYTLEPISNGIVNPGDINTELFLKDCDRLFNEHKKINEDFPYVASPFVYIPWMEAIMGCQVIATPKSFWPEPFIIDWEKWNWETPTLENPWVKKLLELLNALVEHSNGRYPVSHTLMRGPLDMLAAMRGTSALVLDILDKPELIKKAAEICADVWIEVAKAQLNQIPYSETGYMGGGFGYRVWAPQKIVWLQEDTLSVLSPALYKELFINIDKRIAGGFPYTVFHVHGTSLWVIDMLAEMPEINAVELNYETVNQDIEGIFSAYKKIISKKPVVMWREYDDNFWLWLDRVLNDISPEGISIHVNVSNTEEGKKVLDGYFSKIENVANRSCKWK